MRYVVLSPDTTRVELIFGGPQSITDDKPGYAEIADDDPRIAAFEAAQSVPTTLAAKIGAGIVITSTGTPALDATYALDDTTLTQIGAVARDSASGLGLPGGLASFTYPDATGAPHAFTEAQLVALYKAMRDLLFQLNTQAAIMAHGGPPTWPAQSATIA